MDYFYLDQIPNSDDYIIRPDYDKFYLKGTKGSYNIIECRLIGLSYPDYLRMCRDLFGARIVGKNHKYPYAVFKKTILSNDLVKLLNARAALVIKNRKLTQEN